MEISSAGFLRPKQTSSFSASEEATLSAICPGVAVRQSAAGRNDDPLIGPYESVHTGYATDAALRRQASSGGGLSAVLVGLLERGEIDGVIQTTASETLPIGNRWIESFTSDDVFAAAGSRYAPSAPLEGLHAVLERPDGRWCFVGKPCDVAALRALALRDTRVDEKIPLKLSFFCAGVPSLKGARELLARMRVDEADIAAFRYRGDGWPGFARATRRDGSAEKLTYAESWGEVLTRHLQFRCKICPDGVGGFADITFADAWHCDAQGYPLFEEGEGVSLIVSRTKPGADALSRAVSNGDLVIEPLAPQDVRPMQPGQIQRKERVAARVFALAALLRPYPKYRGFGLFAASRRAGVLENVRNFLGTVRRVLRATWART